MKKLSIMLSVSVLLFAGLFILAGCSNGSDSDEAGTKYVGKGVLGQISGVVYNYVTAQPLKDVSVELGGVATVKTDANGGFSFKDVAPGTYTVSFYKEGFQFRTKNVVVDPQAYINDDPFKETKALEDQLAALGEWVKTQQAIPGYEGFGDSGEQSLTWTYQGGVFVDGNGAAVTVTNEAGQFKIEQIKLDYTYSVGIPLYITSLSPLTGAIEASVKLFTKPYSSINSERLDAAIDIDDGVEFWFVESLFGDDPGGIIGWGLGESETGVQPNYDAADAEKFHIAKGGAIFGPATTKDGVLSFTGLPVDIPLKLVGNSFVKDGTNYFYKFGSTPYVYDYAVIGNGGSAQFTNANGVFSDDDPPKEITPTIFKAQNNSVDNKVQNYTKVGTVYLFTEGTFAIINDLDTGNPSEPKKTTDTISLTFSEPIDPATFVAKLQILANRAWADGKAIPTGSILLAGEWDADATTVTLAPIEASEQTGGLRPIFPYSQNVINAIGTLAITGKAQSGARILAVNNNNGIPVFTEEAIKLIEIDVNPSGIPARTIVTAQAIKLVFNKAISKDLSRFYLNVYDLTGDSNTYDNGQQVQFALSADKKSVFVYTDLLKLNEQALWYTVYSDADPVDYVRKQPAGSFNKPEVTRLVLLSTNLYTSGFVSEEGANANFPVAGAIELTFDYDIPFKTAQEIKDNIQVGLSKKYIDSGVIDISGQSISLTKAVDGKKLTIKPTVALEYGTGYYLTVEINKASDVYFKTVDLVDETIVAIEIKASTDKPYKQANIRFTTQEDATSVKIKARPVANNSATSKEFDKVNNEALIGGTIVAGKEYFVQFDGAIKLTAPTNLKPAAKDADDLVFEIRVIGTDVLGITVKLLPGADPDTDEYTNVSLEDAIGDKLTDDPDKKNGAINTETKKFKISGLTVVRE